MFIDKYTVMVKDKEVPEQKTFLKKSEAEEYLAKMKQEKPDLEWIIDYKFESEEF